MLIAVLFYDTIENYFRPTFIINLWWHIAGKKYYEVVLPCMLPAAFPFCFIFFHPEFYDIGYQL